MARKQQNLDREELNLITENSSNSMKRINLNPDSKERETQLKSNWSIHMTLCKHKTACALKVQLPIQNLLAHSQPTNFQFG